MDEEVKKPTMRKPRGQANHTTPTLKEYVEDHAEPVARTPYSPHVQILAAFINMLIELLKVKSLVTFAIVGTVCVLAYQGRIQSDAFMGIAASIITYYFTKPASDRRRESTKVPTDMLDNK